MKTLAILLLAGCGRFGFDNVPLVDDARVTTDGDPVDFALACPAQYSVTFPGSTHRYRHVLPVDTWTIAAADCADDDPQNGAHTHLIVLGDETERLAMADLTNGNLTWIGLSDQVAENTFIAVTTENVDAYPERTEPPWSPGEPNDQLGGEDCGELDDLGLINDKSCDPSSDQYVCECDAFPNDPSRYAAAQCPAAYTLTLPSSTHRYRINLTNLSWEDAALDCVDDSATPGAFTHLIVLADDAERIDIFNALGGDEVWLGLSDRVTEGVFVPVSTEDVGGYPPLTAPPWGMNEPNNSGNIEHCAQNNVFGTFNDNTCSGTGTLLRSVCECDPFPDDPTRH